MTDDSVQSILNEIGIENPDFTSLEIALIEARQNLVNAQHAFENAEKALEEAKKKPDIRDIIKSKIEGMLALGFNQQEIVDALKLQFIKTNVYKNEALPLNNKIKQQIIYFILNLNGSFKAKDVWEKFSSYKRSDIYSNVIVPLVRSGKLIKKGEKRGVYYCVVNERK